MNVFKSKTINFAIILGVIGAVQITLPAIQASVSPAFYGYATIVLAMVVAVLRVLTTTPLKDK